MKIIVKSLALVLVGLTSLVALEVNDKVNNEQQIVKVKVKKQVEQTKQEAKDVKEDEKMKDFKDSIKK
ncbi:hypothetical protein [Arcobacter roscoffensis]|uniref:Uncharacterized protein n=1 Tax=Arcobacter roscoffensis TaxID=2961520 RepID=A0ABY5E8U0_9BACT|nr:hypothetical protein [Arcobacter roscoffensis]UTJ07503.1 hypothetical protein NJU99_05245 [Arcobacter roscoffensis]